MWVSQDIFLELMDLKSAITLKLLEGEVNELIISLPSVKCWDLLGIK